MTREATAGQVPDCYGQVHPNETADLISRKRAEFDMELQKLTSHTTETNKDLVAAMEKCPELLTREFKLMFLRSDVYNVDSAVSRYARYWKKRVDTFGPDKAFQPLTLDKALSEDSATLESGMIRLVVGASDSIGRAIVFVDPSLQDRSKYSRDSVCRALWYTVHAALESETAQKHGVVIMSNSSRVRLGQFDRELARMIFSSLQGAIPLRLSAMHLCHPPAFFSIILPIIKLFLTDRLRKRLQVHNGKTEKVLKHMEGFGLKKSMLPVDLGGDVKLDQDCWLEMRRSKGL